MGELYAELVFNLPVEGPFSYRVPEDLEVQPGVRVEAPFRGRLKTGFVLSVSHEAPPGDFELKDLKKVLDQEALFGEQELELARWLTRMYFCSLGEALSAMIPGGRRERDTDFIPVDEGASRPDHQLSPAQKRALETLMSGDRRMYYLYGVTGSGKTEVFLRAAEELSREGRGVIYLVPEIALTHQLIQEVQRKFGDAVALWHSKLTPSQKLKEWRRIKAGEVKIVIGARSAVFTPLRPLGMVILDEEHESSYKSSQSPRYHARQVAMKRCARDGAKLLMGSATPSLEAYYLMERDKIVRLDLPERVSGGRMPAVKTVSMQGENRSISRELTEEIAKTAKMGKQSILFLNRRGFSYYFHCRSCGYEMKCSHCSVNLTYHKSTGKMQCHYCGYTRNPVDVCPECGSLDIGYSGFGTEKIEEDIRQLFPSLRVARVDTDSTKKRGSLQKILRDFRNGEYDILLGTQMVAKGLNFPGVRLVGIVLADSSLNLPDFRAGERTFALILQVAGRAGRFLEEGEVLVQTFKPAVPAIKLAVEGRLEEFYRQELDVRRELNFPPFARLFRIVIRGKERGKVNVAAHKAARELSQIGLSSAEILGPAPCPLEIIAGKLRMQLIIRSGDFNSTHRALQKWYTNTRAERSVYIEMDVDPVSLL